MCKKKTKIGLKTCTKRRIRRIILCDGSRKIGWVYVSNPAELGLSEVYSFFCARIPALTLLRVLLKPFWNFSSFKDEKGLRNKSESDILLKYIHVVDPVGLAPYQLLPHSLLNLD